MHLQVPEYAQKGKETGMVILIKCIFEWWGKFILNQVFWEKRTTNAVKINLIKNLVLKNKYIYIYTHTFIFFHGSQGSLFPPVSLFLFNISFSEILWTGFVIYLDSCFIPFKISTYILNLSNIFYFTLIIRLIYTDYMKKIKGVY